MIQKPQYIQVIFTTIILIIYQNETNIFKK